MVLFIEPTLSFGGYGQPWKKVSQDEAFRTAKEYWVGHYGLTHLIAFDSVRYRTDSTADRDSTGEYPLVPIETRFEKDYRLDLGYPTIVILDRKGIIRARFIGYGENEKAINTIVDQLLAEPISSP